MDHIEQLKKIRADALNRLRMSEDFRLAGKLSQLLAELGSPVDDHDAMAAAPAAKPSTLTRTPFGSTKAVEDTDANLEDELASKLDAALEDDDDKSSVSFLGSAKKDDTAKAS